MKVLLTADTIGGVWTYALELARALLAHGVEVALATMGAELTPQQAREARSLPGLELHTSRYQLEWMHGPWEDVRRAGEWLLEIEARFRPDVVHLNSAYAHGALPWRAPALVVGHSCVLSWWEAVRGEAAPEYFARYRQEVTRGLRAAAMVAAPTAWMLQALERHYGPLPATRVIPNGRDPARFPPGRKEPFVLSVGRLWDEGKNVGFLDFIAERIPWPIYVAGETQHPEEGRMELSKIRLLGHLDPPALAGWFSRASIYALPARYEPFGLSPLEAALSGCALVLGDIPSLRETWEDAALFVPPLDGAALEAALQRLIADAPRRAALARRARLRALELSPQRMAAGYLAAYRELLKACPERSRGSGAGRWALDAEGRPPRSGYSVQRPASGAKRPCGS